LSGNLSKNRDFTISLKRKNHSDKFKSRIALEAAKGIKTLSEISSETESIQTRSAKETALDRWGAKDFQRRNRRRWLERGRNNRALARRGQTLKNGNLCLSGSANCLICFSSEFFLLFLLVSVVLLGEMSSMRLDSSRLTAIFFVFLEHIHV